MSSARVLILLVAAAALLTAELASAARVKDIVRVKGVRENLLIGYGLVVGLKGTGDSSADVTGKALLRMFNKMGMNIDTEVKSKNVASVVVTARFPAFCQGRPKDRRNRFERGGCCKPRGRHLARDPAPRR